MIGAVRRLRSNSVAIREYSPSPENIAAPLSRKRKQEIKPREFEQPPVVAVKEEKEEKEIEKTPSKASFVTGKGKRRWHGNYPCYEIINIEFESDDDDDDEDDEADDKDKEIFVNFFTGNPGPLAELHVNSEDIGKNIVFEYSDTEKDGNAAEETVNLESEEEESAVNIPWLCPLCEEGKGNKFDTFNAFERHFTDKHSSLPLTCPLCSKRDTTATTLLDHIIRGHLRRYACVPCSLPFRYRSDYRDHMMATHQVTVPLMLHKRGRIRCCSNYFKTPQLLEDHLLLQHEPKCCPVCQEVPRTHLKLMHHLYEKHLLCVYECAEYDCTYQHASPYQVEEHIQRQHSAPFGQKSCPVCRRKFNRKVIYEMHCRRHENEPKRTLGCDICGQKFYSPLAMKVHRGRHLRDRQKFDCGHCEKSFVTAKRYMEHELQHYQHLTCDKCKRTFKSSLRLDEHRRLPDCNRDLFKCSVCQTELSSRISLRRHMLSQHHGEEGEKEEDEDEEEKEEGEKEKEKE